MHVLTAFRAYSVNGNTLGLQPGVESSNLSRSTKLKKWGPGVTGSTSVLHTDGMGSNPMGSTKGKLDGI